MGSERRLNSVKNLENNALVEREYKISGSMHNIFQKVMFISTGNDEGEKGSMNRDNAVR